MAITKNITKTKWYQKSVSDSLATLEVDVEQGLTSLQVADRIEEFGRNEIIDQGGKSIWAAIGISPDILFPEGFHCRIGIVRSQVGMGGKIHLI